MFALYSGTLPTGVALTSDGLLSGAPTAAGVFSFTVEAVSIYTAEVGYPLITGTQAYSVRIIATPSITPASLSSGLVGTPYSATLTGAGGYGAGTYTFSVISGTLPPGINLSAAGGLSGTPTAAGTSTFTVQISSIYSNPNASLPPLTGTQSFTLAIYPALAITTTAASSGSVGTSYFQAFSASGGAGISTYTWSLVQNTTPPPGLTFSTSGVLSGTPTTAGTFSFTVQVSSTLPGNGTIAATQSFSVVISGSSALAITGSLGNGTVGTPYSATLSATGGYGAGTYTFSVTAGTLPSGIKLSTAGVLSGTPTAAGTFALSVQVSSTSANPSASLPPLTATQPFTLVIYPVLAITTAAVSPGSVGIAYSQTFSASGGAGIASYAWSLVQNTTPPPGLTFSTSGVLSGTPTTAGTFPFTVQVSSTLPANGVITASQSFSVVISAFPALAITGSLSAGTVGATYSAALGATGGFGAGTYTFSLSSGSLPPGTQLSAGGVLSGTPTAAGTFPIVVKVTSTQPGLEVTLPPVTATQSFSVVIYPVLAVTPQTLAPGMVGAAYSATIAATGGYGAGTYTFSLASGALPPGITLSASGALSGTPTASGTTTFTVLAASTTTGLPAVRATQSFTIVIYPALSVTPQVLSPGIVAEPYAVGFQPIGGYGVGTYSYSVTAGTLPPGVAMVNGILSGTPTAAGTFTFTVQISNGPVAGAAGLPTLTANQSFTLVIYPALSLTPQTLSPGTVGTPYAVGFQPTGGYGEGTYSYSVTTGTLPPGITMVNGILSGTPTSAGTFTFTVQVANGPVVTTTGLPTFTATQSFTLTVGLPAAPAVAISGLPASPAPATQPVLGLTVGGAYPLAIQGTITLTFAPTSGPDDPNVQFTTGGRTVTFQIPAGSTQAQFAGSTPAVQTGTVAGTIALTLDLTAAGTDITPKPAPTQVLVVAPGAPVIVNMGFASAPDGFSLTLIGYATTRDMTSAAITFTPASGVTLASNTATVSLSQLFTTWYQSSTSAQYGSQFSLTIPFTYSGSTVPISALSVTLTNSQGTSAAATAAH
jgi:hypothetical protein